jgi:hypothetical protein
MFFGKAWYERWQAFAKKKSENARRHEICSPSMHRGSHDGKVTKNQDEEELTTRQRVELPLALPSEATMNGLIYLVGLVVVIMFILSFLGLR